MGYNARYRNGNKSVKNLKINAERLKKKKKLSFRTSPTCSECKIPVVFFEHQLFLLEHNNPCSYFQF